MGQTHWAAAGRLTRGVCLAAVVTTLVAATGAAPAAAVVQTESNPPAAVEDHEHDTTIGLGDYGPRGPIVRELLPDHVNARVTDQAIEVAQAPELAAARASWDVAMDFVGQVNYQLRFRSRTDYLSTDPSHLGVVLAARPRNAGSEMLGLYMTDAEVSELMRRQELGDRIEAVRDALGEPDPVVEGEEPDYGPNFAGVWQDQLDGGAIVVALVDPSLADRAQLEEIVGGKENLRIIDVDYSWDEIDAYYATLAAAMGARGVPGSVLINATGKGRVFEVFTPDPAAVPADVLKLVPAELVSVTEGALVAELTNPYNAHSVQDQQPGLRIVTSSGSGCTWGANGHTASYNYIITAGHCGGASYSNYNDWTSTYEIGQAGTVLLTDGSQYLWSIDSGTWDMQRMSSPKGYSNCYHAVAHCIYFVRWRALLNSWEEGSDLVCASLGYSNTWECGYVLQENYNQPSGDCAGNLWVRYDIPAIQGDSGSGLVGPFAYPALSIDSILACGPIGGPFSFGNTAFDVINQLGFDYNCSNSALTGQAAPWWSPCPTYDR